MRIARLTQPLALGILGEVQGFHKNSHGEGLHEVDTFTSFSLFGSVFEGLERKSLPSLRNAILRSPILTYLGTLALL